LFSQVPTGGFAAFKPPVPSPNRTTFMHATNPQPSGVFIIPPPPVQSKSLGGKKQLGVRCRAPIAASAAAASTLSLPATATAKGSNDRNATDAAIALGQKRERDADVKQVSFAATECPRTLPSRLPVMAAPTSCASSSAPQTVSGNILLPIAAATFNCEPSKLALPPNIIAAAPTVRAPPPPIFSTQGLKRTYGRAARQSAAALEPPAAIFTGQNSGALESPTKAAADDPSRAANSTPGKDHPSVAPAAAAITPNTEPRVSRARASGAMPPSPHAPPSFSDSH
jgi:hypothetical protein